MMVHIVLLQSVEKGIDDENKDDQSVQTLKSNQNNNHSTIDYTKCSFDRVNELAVEIVRFNSPLYAIFCNETYYDILLSYQCSCIYKYVIL